MSWRMVPPKWLGRTQGFTMLLGRFFQALHNNCIDASMAKCLHCVRTACALRAHCVHSAHAEARILTQEYHSSVQ